MENSIHFALERLEGTEWIVDDESARLLNDIDKEILDYVISSLESGSTIRVHDTWIRKHIAKDF